MSISRLVTTISRGETKKVWFNFEGDTEVAIEGVPHVHIKVVEGGYTSAKSNARFRPYDSIGDGAYADPDLEIDVGYVQTSTPKLRVVPGSVEIGGEEPRRKVSADLQCNAEAADGIWKVECIVAAGSEVLRTPMLIHGTDQ